MYNMEAEEIRAAFKNRNDIFIKKIIEQRNIWRAKAIRFGESLDYNTALIFSNYADAADEIINIYNNMVNNE